MTPYLVPCVDDYLTQAIDTNVRAVLRTQGPILHFTGQGKEEIKALSVAVQLAKFLVWIKRQRNRELLYDNIMNVFCRIEILHSSL